AIPICCASGSSVARALPGKPMAEEDVSERVFVAFDFVLEHLPAAGALDDNLGSTAVDSVHLAALNDPLDLPTPSHVDLIIVEVEDGRVEDDPRREGESSSNPEDATAPRQPRLVKCAHQLERSPKRDPGHSGRPPGKNRKQGAQ